MIKKILDWEKELFFLTIGIIGIILFLQGLNVWNKTESISLDAVSSYAEQIKSGGEVERMPIYIDVVTEPVKVAKVSVKEEKLFYYLVQDSENFYVARINDSTYQKMCKHFKSVGTKPYRLKGYLYAIPINVQNGILDALQKNNIPLKDVNSTEHEIGILSPYSCLDEVDVDYQWGRFALLIGIILASIFTLNRLACITQRKLSIRKRENCPKSLKFWTISEMH
ncbi:MAG: hypothetical protein K6G64_00270 [Eubacterium sp.]|nr:hypothetical protein [Eubacterium sp.]